MNTRHMIKKVGISSLSFVKKKEREEDTDLAIGSATPRTQTRPPLLEHRVQHHVKHLEFGGGKGGKEKRKNEHACRLLERRIEYRVYSIT